MKKAFFCGVLALALLPVITDAASSYYINNGTVAPPNPTPVIDASNFVNNSVFSIVDSQLGGYSTFNTRNFTNTGLMLSTYGFRLDTTPSSSPGTRLMAANFYNGPLLLNGGGTVEAQGIPSYLYITATNITSKGLLNISAGGIMKLVGTNINLVRSGLQVKPLSAGTTGTAVISGTNYTSDAGVYDIYWAQTNATFSPTAIYNGLVATSPNHNTSSGTATVQVPAPFPDGYGYSSTNDSSFTQRRLTITLTNSGGTLTNVSIITNEIRQAVFVGKSDSNVVVTVSFSPSDSPTNDFKTVEIGLSQMTTNLVTGFVETNSIYFVDTLASSTARGLAQNDATGAGTLLSPTATYIPANYLLSRTASAGGGQPENIDPTNNFIYNPSFVTNRVNGQYAAYSASIDNLTSRPFNGAVTNNPGRIIISADTLDLTKTRIRAEGLLDIKARNLIGNSNAIVDSENLSFDLGSVSGNLVIKDMIKTTVLRERGTIQAWSALWNNQYYVVLTNYVADTNTPANYTPSPVTNVVNVGEYALIFDATGLLFNAPLPVSVYRLVLHSTNIVIGDPMTVFQNLLFDCKSLTLGSTLNLSGVSSNFTALNAPQLLFFTNAGTMNIPSDAHFGDDRPPYDTFANYGTIFSSGQQQIGSTNIFIRGGVNVSQNTFIMTAKNAVFTGADIESGGEMQLRVDSLRLTNTYVYTGGQLVVVATNLLVDGGWTNASYSSGNLLVCNNGFSLPVKPLTSDLLGTTIEVDAPNFSQIDHVWSGTDLGPVKAGFTNNAAIGRLTLVAGGLSPFFEPLLYFTGTGASNAIYVDDLDLSQITYDYHEVLAFNTNLTIYFAYSQGVPPEVLNGEFGGHLRWVTNFCGPFSSTNTIHDGTNLFPVNRGLVESTNIDSDGDGIKNGLDASPFDPPFDIGTLKVKITPSTQLGKQNLNDPDSFDISWFAAPNGIYQVQYSTTFPPTWMPLLVYTNSSTAQTVIITDKPPVGTSRRFYRVGLAGYSQ